MNKCTPRNRVGSQLSNSLGDFDSLVSQFFTPARAAAAAVSWGGASSVYESEDRLSIELDAPGVTSDQVDLQVENGQLTITLERTPVEGRSFVYNERRFGKVTRTLDLPDTVDPDSIDAELTAGVLRVSVTKRPETKPRRIDVKQN